MSAGGAWLTYRYRVGGEGTREAAGTVKAPSFLDAARRVVARLAERGGDGALGPGPAYLRLRAAGEEEVLVRAARAGPGAAWRVEAVPAGTYAFPPARGAPDPG